MYDYVLLIHPTHEELLFKYEPGMRNRPRPLVKKVLEWMSPFKAAEVEGLNSPLGRTAKGCLVMCPLLMEQMVNLSPTKVMKAVVNALKFAASLNPKIIGLTAYAAFSGNKGLDMTKITDIPLTTGGNYTLATFPEAILRAVDVMEIDLDRSYVLLIGATSSVGQYFIEILTHFVPGMFVTAHNEDKLNILSAELPKEKRSKLHRTNDINSIIDKVGIVIVATNRIPAEFDINKLNPGTLIFDASYPRRIPNDARDDILVIDGVAMKPSGKTEFNFDFGLPPGLCYPCMAEPMILALERKFQPYSLGKESDITKIREILRLGAKNGFDVAQLTSRERVLPENEIIKIKQQSQKKKKRKILSWI